MSDTEEAARPSRLTLVLSSAVSVVVLGGALGAPLIARLAGYERAPADLSEVATYDITARAHSDADLTYPQNPPVGGDHAPVWLECGVYEVPVREENAVHDLEHGTVWLTHDPSLPARDLERLAAALPDNAIMSPRADLASPVVLTVWGAQLALDGAHDERLELFLTEYGDGHTAPETGVTCHGGTPDPTGAAPAPGVGV
ncbi:MULTISPECIES: DUF3105 domain-containing protein [Nocardioides]|uniref:DUF3105 domain-containing protein n=1 Tax=Nocardioides TaxID=1839 RepID=UPI0003302435|nr:MULTISPECIES: DUF3105 domain-containing protein [Nocardioides]EON23668.1 membrane protein [Nocardioides sp. CF8]